MKKGLVKNKILFWFVVLLLVTGCGLKANPVPLASAISQNQDNQILTVSADGKAIVLTWQLENQAVSYIMIEKSQLGSAGNICRACPRRFDKIGQLQAVNTKNEKKEYRFNDLLVEKGNIYGYRLKLCDEAGICRESKTVEIDFK